MRKIVGEKRLMRLLKMKPHLGNEAQNALFEHRNDAVDYLAEGEPLYVVIWNRDEENEDGVIVKQNSKSANGLRHSSPIPRHVIEIWDKPKKNPDNSALESYFESQSIISGKEDLFTVDKCHLNSWTPT